MFPKQQQRADSETDATDGDPWAVTTEPAFGLVHQGPQQGIVYGVVQPHYQQQRGYHSHWDAHHIGVENHNVGGNPVEDKLVARVSHSKSRIPFPGQRRLPVFLSKHDASLPPPVPRPQDTVPIITYYCKEGAVCTAMRRSVRLLRQLSDKMSDVSK